MTNVLITGGNRGYGLALVQECLDKGWRVFVTCRDRAVASDLVALESDTCTVLECDLSSQAQIVDLVATVAKSADQLDLLINNAGRMGMDDLQSLESEELLAKFNINSIAPIMLSREYVPLLRESETPKIVMSSSSWGSIGYKWDPTNKAPDRAFGYCASKTALNMLSRTLAAALRPERITVLIHHPGGQGDPGGGPATARESAAATLSIANAHGLEDTGKFYHWRGYELPW